MFSRHPTWINPLTPFAGRDRDVAAVKQGLAQSRLVTLTGLPGVGKSRLAAAVCEGRDEWHMLDMSAGVHPSTIENALQEAGRVGGLFLDNHQSYTPGLIPVLAECFHRYPDLTVLLTSTGRTGLSGEWIYEVSPLSLADARELLRHLAESANPGLRSAVSAEMVSVLVARVGGLPLAIEWLAQALRVYEPHHLAAAEKLLPYLAAPSHTLSVRRRSMAAVFADALAGLSANAQHTLQALATFADGFTPAMAAELLGVPQEQALVLALGELVDASVMARAVGADMNGFAINPLLREYVWMTTDVRLMQEHQYSLRRWAQKFVDVCVRTLSTHQLTQQLGLQEANILRALAPASDGEVVFEDKDIMMGEQMLRLLGHRGELRRGHALATSFLCNEQNTVWPPGGRARLFLERAKLAIKAGSLGAAAADVAQASQGHGEPQPSLLEVQALLARRHGDTQAADVFYNTAAVMYCNHGEVHKAAVATSERAALAFETREPERAKALFQTAQDMMRSAGNEPSPVMLTNWALLYQEDGELAQAELVLNRALALHKQDGNKRFVAITLADLAGLAFEQGCGAKAAELFASAQNAPADDWDSEQVALVGAARVASLATLHLPAADVPAINASLIEASIRPAVATYLALECYLLRWKAGQSKEAEEALILELANISGHPWTGLRDEIRLALRIAQGYLHAPKLLIRADGSGFRTHESAWVDLRRRPLLGRLLLALATNRLQDAKVGLRSSDLIARGWPGERMREDAAANRLYVALSELRKLGLGPHFPNTRESYRLSHQTMILMCPPTSC